jgi:hypothetical protein
MKNDKKIELLADHLEQQVADSSLTDGSIWQKLAMSERTFYRLKPKAVQVMNTRLTERRNAKEQAITSEVIRATKNGLKTKIERLMILQAQVDAILMDLKRDELPPENKDYLQLSPMDKAYLRKTLKDIQAEISKIEGDYAPAQTEDVTPRESPLDTLNYEQLYQLRHGRKPE